MNDQILLYNLEIEEKILIELDKWYTSENKPSTGEYITDVDGDKLLVDKINKIISSDEIEAIWYSSVDESYVHTRRLSLEEYIKSQQLLFQRAVIVLTAANLWAKYNTTITITNEEDKLIDGQAGRLRKKAYNMLKPFRKIRTIGLNRVCRGQMKPEPPEPVRPWHLNFQTIVELADGCLYSLYEQEEDKNHINLVLTDNGELLVYSDFISTAHIDNGDLILVKKET